MSPSRIWAKMSVTPISRFGIAGWNGLSRSCLVAGQVSDLPEIAQRHQTVDLVAIDVLEFERGAEQIANVVGHAALDLESHRFAEPAPPQLRLDRAQEIVGLVLLQIEVGVARDAEEIRVADVHSGEEPVEMVRDEILEQHEASTPVRLRRERNAAASAES